MTDDPPMAARSQGFPRFEPKSAKDGRWFVVVKTGVGPDSRVGDFATEAEANSWISGPASRCKDSGPM